MFVLSDLKSRISQAGEENSLFFNVNQAMLVHLFVKHLILFQGLIPQGIQYINGQINKQLRYGYNVGKGFVTAEEEVLGYIDYLVDEKEIAQTLINRCNYTKETIIHELGLFIRSP